MKIQYTFLGLLDFFEESKFDVFEEWVKYLHLSEDDAYSLNCLYWLFDQGVVNDDTKVLMSPAILCALVEG